MADKIRLNYPQMQEMVRHMKAVEQRLMQTVQLARKAAQEMQGGAMVGDAGEAFANALNTAFVPAVTKLSQKFGEEAEDINQAMRDMQDEDKKAGSAF